MLMDMDRDRDRDHHHITSTTSRDKKGHTRTHITSSASSRDKGHTHTRDHTHAQAHTSATSRDKEKDQIRDINWDARSSNRSEGRSEATSSKLRETNELLHPALAMLLRDAEVVLAGVGVSGGQTQSDYFRETHQEQESYGYSSLGLEPRHDHRDSSLDPRHGQDQAQGSSSSSSHPHQDGPNSTCQDQVQYKEEQEVPEEAARHYFVSTEILNDINAKGQTALTYVGEEEIGLKILRRPDLHSATINATDILGWNALNHSCYRKFHRLASEILQRDDLEGGLFLPLNHNTPYHSALEYARANGIYWRDVCEKIEKYHAKFGTGGHAISNLQAPSAGDISLE